MYSDSEISETIYAVQPIVAGSDRAIEIEVWDNISDQGAVDLSAAEITFTLTKTRDSVVKVLEKKNQAAGGSTAEISTESNTVTVHLLNTDTDIARTVYTGLLEIVINSKVYKILFSIPII